MAGPYRKDMENKAIQAGIKSGTKNKKSTREIMYMLDRAKRNQEYKKSRSKGEEMLEYRKGRGVKDANRRAYIRENGIDREDAALNRNNFDREVENTIMNNTKWRIDYENARKKKGGR